MSLDTGVSFKAPSTRAVLRVSGRRTRQDGARSAVRGVLLAVLAGCFVSPCLASTDALSWLNDQVLNRIELRGSQVLGLHFHNVEGDYESFTQTAYGFGSNGTFTDIRDINISGRRVLGVLNFDINLNNRPYGMPLDRRISVDYESKSMKVSAGDITASLFNTNPLLTMRKSSSGIQAETKIGNLRVKGAATMSRGAARTVTINGNNSAGPYYLQGSQIVEGSLRVRVDGVDKRLGDDYTANLEIGTLTFINMVIPPTSVIVATYETRGLNQSRENVFGGALAYDMMPGVTIGATHIVQQPRHSRGLQQVTELFQGFGSPNTPYFLMQPPMPGTPVIITVDNVLQVEGVDYYFDPNNPMVFYFTRFMPPTVTIKVVYTPMPDPGSFGNSPRQVSGIDVNWKIGDSGDLTIGAAMSSLKTPLGTETGMAQVARFNYKWGNLGMAANWRNVPGSFVGVSSAGFNRNERGAELRFDYNAGKGLTFNLSGSDLRINTPQYTGSSFSTVGGSSQELRFGANYQIDPRQNMFLNFSNLRGSYNDNANTNRTIVGGYRVESGRWATTVDVSNIHATSPAFGGGGGEPRGEALSMVTTTISGAKVSGSYRASDKLSLNTRIGMNSIQSGGASSTGHDVALNVEYRPFEQLKLNAGFADTFSGAITGLGGYGGGGHGFGYNGNGFTGGAPGIGGGIGGTTRAKVAQAQAQWMPSRSISLDLGFTQSLSVGDNLSNSSFNSAHLTARWSPALTTNVDAQIRQDQVSFTNSPGSSNTMVMNFGVNHKFDDRWSATGHYSSSSFGGSGISGFSQDVTSMGGNLTYRIGPRQEAIAEFRTGNVSGYLADKETFAGIGYLYEIFPGVKILGGYRLRERQGLSSLSAPTSYRAQGLDFEIRIDFRR